MRSHDADLGLVAAMAAAAVLVLSGGIWVSVRLAQPPGYTGSNNPIATAIAVATGQITWTGLCTLVASGLAVLAIALTWLIAWAATRKGSFARRLDRQARHLARHSELGRLTPKAVRDSAMKLRPSLQEAPRRVRKDPDQHGAPIGLHIPSGVMLRETWEDCSVDIWGPRKGKTTARAIPRIVGAPGPCLVSSRKGDIVDATRGPREALDKDARIWIFDPQAMLTDEPGFWWNPLSTVRTMDDASNLAAAFCHRDATASRGFFDDASDELVTNLILAAAVGGKTMREVHAWSTRQRDDEPVKILRAAGHEGAADQVQGIIKLTEKTRSGVYGGANTSLRSLANRDLIRWLTPQPNLPQFKPDDFPTSLDTMYLICTDDPGAPIAVVGAFVTTIWRCGEAAARRAPGRRLDPPMATVADEIANTVKLASVPNVMSYLGSAGCPVSAILQSFSQGKRVWGPDGMQALWSAANNRVVGGGVSDPEFLRFIAEQVGEFDESTVTHQHNGGWTTSSSVSPQGRRRQILSAADLAALPDGRMLLMPSGSRPALLRSQGWWDGPHAEAIQASLDEHDPAGKNQARERWDEADANAFDNIWDGAFAEPGERR